MAVPRSARPVPSRNITDMQHPNDRVTTALNHPEPHISGFAARPEYRGRDYEYHPSDREYDCLGGQ